MRIASLMPTYNRASTEQGRQLLAEAVGSWCDQVGCPERVLIIGNDTPGQPLRCDVPGVLVANWPERFASLGGKLAAMAGIAIEGGAEALTRWDDDDYNLPHRLALSAERLGDGLEWRPANYWWFQAGQPDKLREVVNAGNTHTMAIWRPGVLDLIGGYPDRTGDEDQAFNLALDRAGVSPMRSERLALSEVFYVYRWGVSERHLSGAGGTVDQLQQHWQRIGAADIVEGEHAIEPQRWTVSGREQIAAV